jgi:hypothetical protein
VHEVTTRLLRQNAIVVDNPCPIEFQPTTTTTMNAQLMEVMAANLKKQADKQGMEHVVEASGDIQAGEKPKVTKKPPPGAAQIGMHAMLFQEAQQKEIKLKETPKTWGVKLPSVRDLEKK